MSALTLEDAIAKIATLTPLTEDDAAGFLACSDDERTALIEAYKNAGKMPKASSWDVVLAVLGECASLANLVIPITGAVQGVFQVAALVK